LDLKVRKKVKKHDEALELMFRRLSLKRNDPFKEATTIEIQ
jgi:hypothetical protein